jgi:hypothetical protein
MGTCWLDEFVGKEKDTAECDGLMFTLPKEIRQDEICLFKSKWFDYRGLHPVKATYYFAHCFVVAYKRAYATTRDLEASKTIKPFRVDDVFNSSDINAVWRARQACDSAGVSYEFYVKHALEVCYKGGWRYLPRPNQIYSSAMIDEVTDAWEIYCKDILQIVKDQSQYGTKELSDWYIRQLKFRASPAYSASKLIKTGILTALEIADGLSEAVATKAVRLNCL